jgi:PAS domain S-box-containing protein
MRANVLFFCWDNAVLSQCAEAALKAHGGEIIGQVTSAGAVAGEVPAPLVAALRLRGIDWTGARSKTLRDVSDQRFDVVVALGARAREVLATGALPADVTRRAGDKDDSAWRKSLFGGIPSFLYWPVEDVEAKASDFGGLCDKMIALIQLFVEKGFISALARQHHRLQTVTDMMQEGVLAHDAQRRIYLFNREAERITGYRREEVLGRDCHEIFQGGFCGADCGFCEGSVRSGESRDYQVNFPCKDGQTRRLALRVTALDVGPQGEAGGVIASLRDVTELDDLRFKLERRQSFHGIVAQSRLMRGVFETIRDVAVSDYSVLVTGESGTGKELVAGAIHHESRRRGGPFVPVNCGALPENILESELFGHVRGAFTGAVRDKKGRFELAHRGTIFLDEVGELSPAFQVRLLRVLQERCFEPVGGEKTIQVDVRVIAATNRDLRALVAEGKFRQDLFYRLAVVPIELPPLRARREDIPLLAERFLEDIRQETGKPIERLSDAAMDLLMSHRWPGNVRELLNVLQYASVRCQGGDVEARHLPVEIRGAMAVEPLSNEDAAISEDGDSDDADRLTRLTREQVERALAETNGSKVKAAKVLGVGRATLYRFLSRNNML